MRYEFLIPRRPVSLQTKNKANLQAWKQYVRGEAAKTWTSEPRSGLDMQLMLVYLFDGDPIDVDNIIKPIQDALVGLVYDDDLTITDVESHRRSLSGTFEWGNLPTMLLEGVLSGEECVYVQVSAAGTLENYV